MELLFVGIAGIYAASLLQGIFVRLGVSTVTNAVLSYGSAVNISLFSNITQAILGFVAWFSAPSSTLSLIGGNSVLTVLVLMLPPFTVGPFFYGLMIEGKTGARIGIIKGFLVQLFVSVVTLPLIVLNVATGRLSL